MDKKIFLPLRWPVFINVAKDYFALDTDGMRLFTISTQYTADRIPFLVFGNQFFELNMDYRPERPVLDGFSFSKHTVLPFALKLYLIMTKLY